MKCLYKLHHNTKSTEMKPIILTLVYALFLINTTIGQSTKKDSRYFGEPILIDSTSTFLIPTHYEVGLFSKDGMIGGNLYSNIIIYNFKTDSSKRLFKNDTYIRSLDLSTRSFYQDTKPNYSITSNKILYRVLNVDRNKDGIIDSKDPTILYASDFNGNNLKVLTSSNENVVGLELFREQNIALVKIQRDKNNDGKFNYKDTDYYYTKLNLSTLTFGKKIETGSNLYR